jgi:hypothetical protein
MQLPQCTMPDTACGLICLVHCMVHPAWPDLLQHRDVHKLALTLLNAHRLHSTLHEHLDLMLCSTASQVMRNAKASVLSRCLLCRRQGIHSMLWSVRTVHNCLWLAVAALWDWAVLYQASISKQNVHGRQGLGVRSSRDAGRRTGWPSQLATM